jgi:transposase
MVRNVAPSQRQKAVEMLKVGILNDEAIAVACSMSSGAVRRYKRNLELFPKYEGRSPPTKKGPARLIETQAFDALIVHLIRKPGTYLDEMVVFLADEFSVDVSTATVSRALSKYGWSKKKVKERRLSSYIFET